MPTLVKSDLAKYSRITDAQRNIRDSGEFIDEVMDRFLNGTHLTGIKLPFRLFENVFRFRQQEITVLAGINGAGKSMFAGQVMLNAVDQGYSCLSISLEMSPQSQISRMIRQASLQASPKMYAVLDFARWAKEKLYFYDQHGSVDPNTLNSVLRYAVADHEV